MWAYFEVMERTNLSVYKNGRRKENSGDLTNTFDIIWAVCGLSERAALCMRVRGFDVCRDWMADWVQQSSGALVSGCRNKVGNTPSGIRDI